MSTGAKIGVGVGVGLGVVAAIILAGIIALRRRQSGSQGREIAGEKEASPRCSSHDDEFLVPPSTSTAIYSMGDFGTESVELESKARLPYMPYRAPGLQDGPAELPAEGTPPKYEDAS